MGLLFNSCFVDDEDIVVFTVISVDKRTLKSEYCNIII